MTTTPCGGSWWARLCFGQKNWRVDGWRRRVGRGTPRMHCLRQRKEKRSTQVNIQWLLSRGAFWSTWCPRKIHICFSLFLTHQTSHLQPAERRREMYYLSVRVERQRIKRKRTKESVGHIFKADKIQAHHSGGFLSGRISGAVLSWWLRSLWYTDLDQYGLYSHHYVISSSPGHAPPPHRI